MDITDVRKALWAAYQRAAQLPCGIEGKSSEAWCEVQYPTYWDCLDDPDSFLLPCGVMVYSYALGPSRQHYFNRAKRDRKVNYYTWESPNPFAKAVEVIGEWVKELEAREAE